MGGSRNKLTIKVVYVKRSSQTYTIFLPCPAFPVCKTYTFKNILTRK